MLNQKLMQTPAIHLQPHLPSHQVMLQLLHLIQLQRWLDVDMPNTGNIRLPISIDHKSSVNALHYAPIILLDALYEGMDR